MRALRFRALVVVAAVVAALAVPTPGAQGQSQPQAAAKLSPSLALVVERGGYGFDISKVVTGHKAGDVYTMAQVAAIDAPTLAALRQAGARVRFTFERIGWVALTSPVTAVRRIAALPQVQRMQVDRVLEVAAITTNVARFRDQSKRGTKDIGADVLWRAGITGKGVNVGVTDTGIDQQHPDIGPKVAAFADCTQVVPTFLEDPERAGTCRPQVGYDDHGHGTHVSGIAAGAGTNDRNLPGVAPNASLMGAKVCLAAGSCLNSSVLAGLEWLAAAGADVINVSLGSGRFYFAGASGAEQVTNNDPEAQLVNRLAIDKNIVFSISAGNSGPTLQSLGAPAVASQAIAVGASITDFDRNHPAEETQHGVLGNLRPEAAAAGASAIAQFSSRGPSGDRLIKPELTAPGSYYVAAESGQGAELRAVDAAMGHHYAQDGEYAVLSGTSMSAPAAAGAAALVIDAYRQAVGRDPSWYEVKAALANTATTKAFEGSVTGLLSGLRAKYLGEDPEETFPLRNDDWVGVTGEGAGRIWAPAAALAATGGVLAFTRQVGEDIDDIGELQPNWPAGMVRPGVAEHQTFTLRGGPNMYAQNTEITWRVESGREADGVLAAPASWFKLPESTAVARGVDRYMTARVTPAMSAKPGHYTATIVGTVNLGAGATQTVRLPVQLFVPVVDRTSAEGTPTAVEGPVWASDTTDYSAAGWANPLGDIHTDWTLIPLVLPTDTKRVDFKLWDVDAENPSHLDLFVFDDDGIEIDSTASFHFDGIVPGGLLNSGTPPDDPAEESLLDGNDIEEIDFSKGPVTVWLAVSNTGPANAPGFATYHLDVDVVR